jgi:hypothetical protein
MKKWTFRLTQGLGVALNRHAKAQGVAPSVIVRDALSAYLMLQASVGDVAQQLTALCDQQKMLTTLLHRMLGHEGISGKPVLEQRGSGNTVLDRLQQRQLTEEVAHGTRDD